MLFKDDENITLIHSGDEYFIMMKEIIENAREEIHLQTYIFENDETGNDIANCLKEAAHRNVKVYIILDAYGSSSLTDNFTKDLQQNGIFFRFFSPLFSFNNFYLGRRMHHKVVVTDGSKALIGGINIGDKYHGNMNTEPWLDYAVQLYCTAAEDLQKLCSDYFFKKGSSRKIQPVLHSADGARIGVLQNDCLQGKTEVCDAYTRAISNAEKEIVIIASYFLPGSKLTKALKKACAKGIKTKIILAGVSDVPLVRRATEHLYTSLLGHNLKIYEWNKSVVHGKAAMVDNKWSIVGSFNLNSLSCYGSIEMNVEIQSVKFAKNLQSDFKKVMNECSEITLETLRKRSGMFKNLVNWVSYQIVRTSMLFLTFLPHLRFLKNYRF
ncbi:phospholipase D-like domain-containing protein [Algibacter luteus]|uniref:phospholipase D-like domain-containing protein n=1 Tax=Algibacter luteus TaxID=1178825 RepID=UPI002597559D|nr:phosphatidylserine/phosphatidylglycerophosphate/cardiolipin synthase family protein [Algibacter luteus]WJJ96461.1 phosphatidylserine/phosphatidylglycerophosphate/cardiolipin synthase family protein [Algibacter luteus]